MTRPYVYRLIHKQTGQFYIGYRCANKLSPEEDIIIYQSSSKTVKTMGFNNFNIEIVAMFFSKLDAYDYEQQLIYENIDNELILNKSVYINGKRFVNHGHTDETKRKMSESRKGLKKSQQMVNKMKATKTGRSKRSGRNPESDKVALTNLKNRIQNFTLTSLEELSTHIKELSYSGMSNVKISQHLNISQTAVAKYKQMQFV